MKETWTRIPGVVIGKITGAARDGRPRVRWEDGPKRGKAIPFVWMPGAPSWSALKGSRVLVGFVDGDPSEPILLGLLDAPPEPEAPKTLRLAGEEEVVLECGKAKISLRSDGKVQILGGYVVSRSTGVNKLKGGSVQIN